MWKIHKRFQRLSWTCEKLSLSGVRNVLKFCLERRKFAQFPFFLPSAHEQQKVVFFVCFFFGGGGDWNTCQSCLSLLDCVLYSLQSDSQNMTTPSKWLNHNCTNTCVYSLMPYMAWHCIILWRLMFVSKLNFKNKIVQFLVSALAS